MSTTTIQKIQHYTQQHHGLPLLIEISDHSRGGVSFTMQLTLLNDGKIRGQGRVTQAINPPLNVETFDISGNYFSTLLFGVPDKLFIQGEGLTFSTSKQQQLLTQSNIVDPVNTKFQIALDSSLKEGNGSFQYIDFSNPQPEWNDVENVPVVVKPFLAFDKV